MTHYLGPYEGLKGAWEAVMAEMSSRGLSPRWPGWEEYLVAPHMVSDPAKYETVLASGVE